MRCVNEERAGDLAAVAEAAAPSYSSSLSASPFGQLPVPVPQYFHCLSVLTYKYWTHNTPLAHIVHPVRVFLERYVSVAIQTQPCSIAYHQFQFAGLGTWIRRTALPQITVGGLWPLLVVGLRLRASSLPHNLSTPTLPASP